MIIKDFLKLISQILFGVVVPVLTIVKSDSIENFDNSNNGLVWKIGVIVVFAIVFAFLIFPIKRSNKNRTNSVSLFLIPLSVCGLWMFNRFFVDVYIFSISFFIILIIDFLYLRDKSSGYRTYLSSSITPFLISIIFSIISITFLIKYMTSDKRNNSTEKANIENQVEVFNSKIDSLEDLNNPIFITSNNKQGNIYITFMLNDSISGYYVSSQGITYVIQGKRKMDSIYQGVMININNAKEENHFHFNVNSNNTISGDFVIRNKTVHINENVIVDDSEEPPTAESEPPTSKEDKKSDYTKKTQEQERERDNQGVENIKNKYYEL